MNKNIKKELLAAWAEIEKSNPDFYKSVEGIRRGCEFIHSLNISNIVNDTVANILGNVIIMATLYERVKNDWWILRISQKSRRL